MKHSAITIFVLLGCVCLLNAAGTFGNGGVGNDCDDPGGVDHTACTTNDGTPDYLNEGWATGEGPGKEGPTRCGTNYQIGTVPNSDPPIPYYTPQLCGPHEYVDAGE